MKKLFFLLSLMTIVICSNAQITFLYSMPYANVYHAKFHYAGDKWVVINYNTNLITIFNLNNTVYKTINMVPPPNNLFTYISYLSENLFDTDPTDFEYLRFYETPSASQFNINTVIYDEAGNLIFSRDSFALTSFGGAINNAGVDDPPIFVKGNSTYMRISNASAPQTTVDKTEIYKLPGILYPNAPELSGNETGGVSDAPETSYKLFAAPNPSSNETKVFYDLPDGITTGSLIVYKLDGTETKRYQVSNVFQYITVTTADLPEGTYTYAIETSAGLAKGKQMVVVH